MINKKFINFLLFIICSGFLLSSCSNGEEEKKELEIPPKQVSVMKIDEDTLYTPIIFSTGTIKANKEVVIKSEASGQVTSVFFDIGDKVKTGETIAILEGNSENTALINYNNAETSLSDAYKTLANTKKTQEKNIESAEISVKNSEIAVKEAEIALERAKSSESNTGQVQNENIAAAQIALRKAEIDLENAKQSTENNLKNVIDSTITQSEGIFFSAESSLRAINNIIDYEDASKGINDYFEDVLGVLNSSSVITSERSYAKARDELAELEKKFNRINKENYTELEKFFSELEKYLSEKLIKSLDDTYYLLNKTITSNNFSQTQLDALKSAIEKNKIAINGYISSLKSSIQGISSTKIANKSTLDSYEKALESTQKNLDTVLASNVGNTDQLSFSVSSAEETLKNVKLNLEKAKKTLEISKTNYDSSVQSIETQINSLEFQKDLASINLGNLIIKAPFEGVVTERYIENGDFINPGSSIIKLSVLKPLKVEVGVSDSDRDKVFIGSEVKIISQNKEFKGNISKINPASNEVSKKFDVEISVEGDLDPSLKPGVFVEAHIYYKPSEENNDRFIIPLSAVHIDKKDYIYKVEDAQAVRYEVKIGKIIGENIVIEEGLKKGDILVDRNSRRLTEERENIEIVD